MSVSHIIGALSLIIIFGCIIWTSVNKKKYPEKYKNEKGNPFVNYLIDKGEISDGNSFDYDITGIRMITKKGNGPIIKRLRYYSKKND